MNVFELHAKLPEAISAGKGNYPVEVMHVVDGAPFTVDIKHADIAFEEWYGEHFWLYCGDAFAPEWAERFKVPT
jgi:hypothetical protein